MLRRWTRYRWPAALLLAGLVMAPGGAAMAATPAAARADELRSALEAQPRTAHGARVYNKRCVACHARDGSGSSNGIVPTLAGQHFRYLVKQIAEFRDHERFAGDIHDQAAREGIDGPQAIADVAAYLAELPANPRPQTGPGTRLARGAELYRAACESCHRDSALGSDSLGIPVLRAQHYSYLVRQMRDIGNLHRVNTPPDLILLMKDMPLEDVEALADYLSRLEEPAVMATPSAIDTARPRDTVRLRGTAAPW